MKFDDFIRKENDLTEKIHEIQDPARHDYRLCSVGLNGCEVCNKLQPILQERFEFERKNLGVANGDVQTIANTTIMIKKVFEMLKEGD